MSVRAANTLAIIFIAVGLVLIGFGLYGTPIKWLVFTGVGVSVFGALIYPSGGAGPALQTIVVALGSVPIFGGRRVGDIPAPVPPVQPSEGEKK